MARVIEFKGYDQYGEFLVPGFKLPDGTIFTSYAGTPESHVAANKGSVCLDITNGAVYVKTTDTVATGWAALDKATGHDQAGEISIVDTTAGSGATTVQGFVDAIMASGFLKVATGKGLKVNNKQVVSDQVALIADAATQTLTGSDTVDITKLTADLTSVKNAVNAVIAAMKSHGLIASA